MSAPVSIVTGGASGIGLAVVQRLASRGDTVVLLDRAEEAGEAAAAAARAAGFDVMFRAIDLVEVAAIGRAVDGVVEEHGRIDTLVNNAGIAIARPFLDYRPEEWDLIMQINVRGAFYAQQAAATHMVLAGHGSIVNIASTAAFVSSSTPESVYDMSKAAIRQMTVSTAVELAPLGVRVNAVAPGTIATDLTLAVLDTEEKLARAGAKIPARRLGRPADIAAAVAFLSSPDAAYIHGHVLVVDGGWLLE